MITRALHGLSSRMFLCRDGERSCGSLFSSQRLWLTLARTKIKLPDFLRHVYLLPGHSSDSSVHMRRAHRTSGVLQYQELAAIFLLLSVNHAPSRSNARLRRFLDTVHIALRSTERLIAKLTLIKQSLLHDLLTLGYQRARRNLRDSLRDPQWSFSLIQRSGSHPSPGSWSPLRQHCSDHASGSRALPSGRQG